MIRFDRGHQPGTLECGWVWSNGANSYAPEMELDQPHCEKAEEQYHQGVFKSQQQLRWCVSVVDVRLSLTQLEQRRTVVTAELLICRMSVNSVYQCGKCSRLSSVAVHINRMCPLVKSTDIIEPVKFCILWCHVWISLSSALCDHDLTRSMFAGQLKTSRRWWTYLAPFSCFKHCLWVSHERIWGSLSSRYTNFTHCYYYYYYSGSLTPSTDIMTYFSVTWGWRSWIIAHVTYLLQCCSSTVPVTGPNLGLVSFFLFFVCVCNLCYLYSFVKMHCGVFWFTFVCSFSALTLLVGSFDP